MDQHNRYLWWDSPKSLCVKHKSSLNTVLKSCLKLLEAVRTVGWRFVLLSFDFSGYFKNVGTGHLVTKHYTSSIELTWFIVSETRVQQTFALLLMRYIKFPFNISLRHKDGARERETERAREGIWLWSHCSQNMSDFFGVAYRDLGQSLRAGFQL